MIDQTTFNPTSSSPYMPQHEPLSIQLTTPQPTVTQHNTDLPATLTPLNTAEKEELAKLRKMINQMQQWVSDLENKS